MLFFAVFPKGNSMLVLVKDRSVPAQTRILDLDLPFVQWVHPVSKLKTSVMLKQFVAACGPLAKVNKK